MKPSRSLCRPLLLIVLMALVQMAGVSAQVERTANASLATLRAVRFHVEPGQTRVWLETSGAVLYTHYSPDPLTLVVDLPGVDISALPARTVVGSREVESILATSLDGVNGKRLSRIEIKLAAITPYQLSGSEQALNIVFDGSDIPEPTPSSSPENLVSGSAMAADVASPSPDLAPDLAPDLTPDLTPEPIQTASTDPIEDVRATPSVTPPPAPSHPASAIESISHEMLGDVLRVNVGADGRLNYTSFALDGPRRLVFDFNGVLNTVPRAALTIDEIGVARVRVAQFRTANPQITRVVFDLDEDVSHRASEQRGGIEIAFARSSESLAPTPAFAALETLELVQVEGAREEESMGPEGAELKDTFAPNALLDDATRPVAALTAGAGGAYLIRDASLASEDGGSFTPVTLTAQDLSLADPGPMLPAPPPPQDNVSQIPSGPTGTADSNLGENQYTGELISLDFKDGDIQDIFRLFADISGLNIVVQPGVTGRITLKLTEVPWDQALDLILKTNKLGFIVEGNVIRIAPLSELASEAAERRRLAEEEALAGELFTQTRVLSYARASDIMPLLQRNLSARGDIVTDERTNTVIFTDLAAGVADVNALIDTLDTPIPGVEIEARIVVTTRTFARQLGVQWGFTSNQTQALGNTTELTFPNRVQLDGQSIGSDSARNFAVAGLEGEQGGVLPPNSLEGATSVQRGYAVNLPFAGAPTGAVCLSLGSITGAFNIDAAISAAETRGQVRIISAPKIITQNNQQAEIKQGTTFPVQVVANNTITVQFKDAVLELLVTPQITSAQTIILAIEINNDSLDFGQSVNGIPSIVTQSATTQVLVADGSTTVIGGVFVNRSNLTERYVPLLHKIPILGYLFKSKSVDSRNEELLIFLTPRIRKDTV